MPNLTLVLESRKPSKGLGHKRKVMQDENGVMYLECNNPECEQPMKPFDMFYDKKGKFQGKREECTVCGNKGLKQWAKENPDKVKQSNDKWKRNNPEKMKATWKKSSRKQYLKNREKRKEQHRIWRENISDEQRERLRKSVRKWQLENADRVRANWNKRRVRLLGAENTIHPNDAMKQYKDIYGEVCGFTGLFLVRDSIEHLVPVSRGGGNTEFNLFPSEYDLNNSKFNTNVFEWIKRRTDVDFTFFFQVTLPYLAEQKGCTVEEFTKYINEKYEEDTGVA